MDFQKISKIDIINCCKSNIQYEKLMENLWGYIEKSYGETIPFGRYYEEIYSIIRFVSAWQPKPEDKVKCECYIIL